MRTLRDAVYGLAVGDALGVPVEFEERDSFHIETMTGHGTHDKEPGTWSDDTSLTLATCDSLKLMGIIDLEDLRCCFTDWYKEGKYTPDGEVFDVGITTGAALGRGEGMTDEWSNGNGSLMRIIPLAFIPDIKDDEIREVSAITHGHRTAKTFRISSRGGGVAERKSEKQRLCGRHFGGGDLESCKYILFQGCAY